MVVLTGIAPWLIEPLDGCAFASVNESSMFGLITCGGSVGLGPTPESSGAGADSTAALQ